MYGSIYFEVAEKLPFWRFMNLKSLIKSGISNVKFKKEDFFSNLNLGSPIRMCILNFLLIICPVYDIFNQF